MPVSTSYGVDVTNGLVGGQDIEQSGSIFALEDLSIFLSGLFDYSRVPFNTDIKYQHSHSRSAQSLALIYLKSYKSHS